MSGRLEISAERGTLEIDLGRRSLARQIAVAKEADPNAPGVPVLVTGYIVGASDVSDECQTYSLKVTDVHTEADCVAVYSGVSKVGSPFEIGAGDIERLDALAERALATGIGTLYSAAYHAQGRVSVPSGWLRALVAGYRAAHPETAAYLFSVSPRRGDESVLEVAVVEKAQWEETRSPEPGFVADALQGRMPPGGREIRPGVLEYRGITADDLRVHLNDTGLRELSEIAGSRP